MARAATAAKTHVVPIFAPKMESALREAFSVFLMQMGLLPDANAGQLQPILARIDEMVDMLFDEIGAGFDLEASVPVRDYHYAHPARVAELTMVLTKLAGAKRAQVRAAGTAALFMNLSNVRLKTSILENSGALSEGDLATVRLHPRDSATMLEHAGLPQDVLDAIEQHHERWDGSGYPDRRATTTISVLARIIGVADTYVTLVSPRPHRGQAPRAAAERFFREQAGTLFDPKVVRLLLEEMPQRYET
jgi:HD-GYP domain-containing protein (c-di-GMP phosphodiesterase class II)